MSDSKPTGVKEVLAPSLVAGRLGNFIWLLLAWNVSEPKLWMDGRIFGLYVFHAGLHGTRSLKQLKCQHSILKPVVLREELTVEVDLCML